MVLLNLLDDNFEGVFEAADKSIEYNSDNSDLYQYLASAYVQIKEYEKALETYNKAFEKETDGSNWLSRNPENVKKYRHDLLCGYMFTVNAYYHMFSGMIKMNT